MAEISAFTQLMSRYYLIGFAAPTFAWLVFLDLALTESFKPRYFDEIALAQVAVLAVASIVLTILVVPLRHELFAAAGGGLSRTGEREPRFPYGQAIEQWRGQVKDRWGEETGTLWPLVRSLTTDREQAYLDEGETNATVLLLVALFSALSLIVPIDFVLHREQPWWIDVLALAAPAVLAALLYWEAVRTATRNGIQVIASIELHYAEVVERRRQLHV